MRTAAFVLLFAILNAFISFAQQNSCDYAVEILANSSVFEKQDFSWRIKAIKIEGIPTNITGTAQIEDSKGQIVKKYKPWNNEPISKQKTSSKYSPNLEEGMYKLIAQIDAACNDTKKDNNADFRLIKIVKKYENIPENNNQIPPQATNEIKNTETANATVNDSIQINNPNVTGNIIEMQNNQIIKNDSIEQQKENSDEEENVIMLHGKNDKNLITANAEQQVVYESSNEKAKKLIMLTLLVLSILLNIVLIWRR